MSDSQSTPKLCSFPGCGRPHQAKGLCKAHWRQVRRGNVLSPLNSTRRPNGTLPRIRYDEIPCPRADLKGPCHRFRGCHQSTGYGQVAFMGKRVLVHVYVWERANGPVPPGLEIDHQCMVNDCCNIDHLRAVTHQVNSTENLKSPSGWQLNAAKTHCKRGHPFDEQNTYIYRGNRWCRRCQKIRAKLRADKVS